jgi:ABC-2 type transport system permease protein
MTKFAQRFQRDWFILSTLVMKDFKLKYRRSMLGVLWSVLNPFLMMVVMATVFTVFVRDDPDAQPFPIYLILGTTLFTLMSNSTTSGASSILAAAGLIKKVRINKMLFPLEKVVFELVNFALSLVAVVLVLTFFRITPTLNLLLLPLLLTYLLLFCTGLSLLLSALAVFFTDIIYLWGVVIVAWTYGTPLFYSTRELTDAMMTVMAFNPMYHYVTYFRSIVMWGLTPSLAENLVCLGMAAVTFLVGLSVFRMTEKRFILFV